MKAEDHSGEGQAVDLLIVIVFPVTLLLFVQVKPIDLEASVVQELEGERRGVVPVDLD